ncbi:MAG: hypothetical protein CM15mP49_35790 [Actinomycetota bacterium]|nr:MAG: hypothetical protein CM15mP49_35790 [Actinomycetota bacterium]
MKALVFERKELIRCCVYWLSVSWSWFSSWALSLKDIEPPEIPADGWKEVFPIAVGYMWKDLATVDGKSSRYFDPLVSFPFVPGHEYSETRRWNEGCLEPVLRGRKSREQPAFEGACPGDGDDYGYL